MLLSTILFNAFATLTSALPTTLSERAGGPSTKPIPDTCKLSDPHEQTASAPSDFIPAPSVKSVELYAAYYPSPSSNTTQMAQQCLEQCYGYGTSIECKGAFWAENMVVPPGYYGSPGGQLETACVFYTRALTEADFEEAPEGQGTGAYARNIAC
ncbi:hypothetical protein DPSP01_005952 [Paraphaeosphaeria sporulosa]|uniref:Apple domain-containing protein n=1 Tax=Paraphaeosphaeria sporulosa TaxID=1460663 RepID=A0A177C9A1_9PLEO|nr:uncharacterized protein CC84DRAFT_1197629 [Paraphaeosphaeria sporulosa]OAG04145.1 hypothetical protein CC84DRAFT_1197629 [Paraphaeosphaeria sporulosa]